MTIEELISLTRRLEGQAVSFKTLAANSLLLNFNGPPGSPDLWTIWLEPSWRYESSSEVIVGSEGLPYPEPDQSEDDSEAQFSEFCHRSDPIEGTVVEKISIDPISRDMTLKLADGVPPFGRFPAVIWTKRGG